VILGVLAGCGNGEEPTTPTTAAPTETTAAPTDTTAAPTETTVAPTETTAAPAAYIPDVVNVGIDGDPTDLDPFSAVSFKNGTVNPLFMQTLGYLNPDGTYSGVLMKSYEQPDSKTVSVTLYENIVDQAGNPFKASDAVWSLQKHMDAQSRYTSNIESVEATGEFTFTVHAKGDLLLNDITNLFTDLFMVTQAAYEADPDHMMTKPVTTAPYKVTEYVAGSSLTLEAWDGYWKTDESLKTPIELQNVKKMNFLIIMEASQMTMALQTGQIDFAQNIRVDDLAYFKEGGENADQFEVFSLEEGLNNVLYPNSNPASPCSDQRVREAIFHAIDAQALVTSTFGPDAVPSKCVGNTSYVDYNPAWATADYWSYDVEKAKALLAEAGYNEGNKLKLRVFVMDHPTWKPMMEVVQGFLNATGVIEAELNVLQGGAFFGETTDPTKWDLKEQFATSSDFISSCWSNLNFSNQPGGPVIGIQDQQLETLINAARSLATHSQETVDAAQAYINEKAYAYGISANYVNIVYPDWVSDFVLSDHKWISPNACTYEEH
jgi:ABC-type transport system substrate-binding protein